MRENINILKRVCKTMLIGFSVLLAVPNSAYKDDDPSKIFFIMDWA